jgi:hypothetical protein
MLAGPVSAQIDYRNLDDDRPVAVTDAYPVERRAMELMLPYAFERGHGSTLHTITPEFSWGEFANTQLTFKAPFLIHDGETGFTGLRGAVLYNFFTESPSLPAISLRADVHLPVGDLGGRDPRGALILLGTRSFGGWRTHVNASWGFRDPAEPSTAHPLPRWSVGGAIDRTLYRQSMLLVASVSASAIARGAPTETVAGFGVRWQWTPGLVLDAGLERRLSSAGPDFGATIGFTHTLSMPWIDRARKPTGQDPPPRLSASLPERRSETAYYPGSFNWTFLEKYPEAARLFHAFDYGHAILYERLLNGEGDLLEARDYGFLTTDLLRRPPRLAIAEEAVAPDYARLAWRAKSMFDWAHLLHRQIYDLYSDPRLADSSRAMMVERITDDYLANRRLAFTTVPKSMALMDSAYYSLAFREKYPRFNGLIWAYHWLQVGLYEPLMTGGSTAERRVGVDSTLATFWRLLDDAPTNMPATMPMTPQVAPIFAARHPRAAAIFDNLHMMHDIIADILASEKVPPEKKRLEIYRALTEFQDGSRNAMAPGHLH